ncbi:MAG: hypothetical protein COA45_08170 [Zetaproteobacteria bacterium]|nr:MAG: hypothetical protein COA45_08170 [Zetaproteobacteria bacterium]
MHINGRKFDLAFKGWVHPPQEEGGNVISINDDNLRACFSRHVWDASEGKVDMGDVYHSVDALLMQEECLSCDKDKISFPVELEQVVNALKAYKGPENTTPHLHSYHDEGYGFYPREMEI